MGSVTKKGSDPAGALSGGEISLRSMAVSFVWCKQASTEAIGKRCSLIWLVCKLVGLCRLLLLLLFLRQLLDVHMVLVPVTPSALHRHSQCQSGIVLLGSQCLKSLHRRFRQIQR